MQHFSGSASLAWGFHSPSRLYIPFCNCSTLTTWNPLATDFVGILHFQRATELFILSRGMQETNWAEHNINRTITKHFVSSDDMIRSPRTSPSFVFLHHRIWSNHPIDLSGGVEFQSEDGVSGAKIHPALGSGTHLFEGLAGLSVWRRTSRKHRRKSSCDS